MQNTRTKPMQNTRTNPMKSTNEGPQMTLLKKSPPSKKTPDLEPRGRRRAPLSPWPKFFRRILPLVLPLIHLQVTFDAVVQVHSDATMTHAREQ